MFVNSPSDLVDLIKIMKLLSKFDIDISTISELKKFDSMSNDNYLINSDKGSIVVRINNEDNSKIVDRETEVFNTNKIVKAGYAPYSEFLDNTKISKFLKSRKFDKSKDIKDIANFIYEFHNSGIELGNDFNPFSLADKYIRNSDRSKYGDLMAIVNRDINDLGLIMDNELEEINRSNKYKKLVKVPCHIDLVPENILVIDKDSGAASKSIKFIDFEYSGMYYKEWDLADLVIECKLSREEELELLRYYGSDINTSLYHIMKSLTNLLWSAWTIYYMSTKENTIELTDYFFNRYSEYKKYYEIIEKGRL